jgi:hypothetical protein
MTIIAASLKHMYLNGCDKNPQWKKVPELCSGDQLNIIVRSKIFSATYLKKIISEIQNLIE